LEHFWIAFTHIYGVGAVRIRHLHDYFGSLETAWFADATDLLAAGLPAAAVEDVQKQRRTLHPDQYLDELQKVGAWVVTPIHEDYPELLKEVPNAPAVLYIKGTLMPQDNLSVAVVGTRKASNYGLEMTRRLTEGLAQQGVTIISGLARGIDAIAHQEALKNGSRTIAVLGNGIDKVYPSEHRRLAADIAEHGAVITEFPPGTDPLAGNFPARNRIISGMSLGVLVIEAPEKSGALTTATFAGEQGRDVFAVPGNVTSPNSTGTNKLIQDGVKLVMDATDILNELNMTYQAVETRQVVREVSPDTPLEQQIIDLLVVEPLHVDDISRQCGLSIQDVNVVLTLMELKGLVFQSSPMTYNINS
jgi:DNA processing protein